MFNKWIEWLIQEIFKIGDVALRYVIFWPFYDQNEAASFPLRVKTHVRPDSRFIYMLKCFGMSLAGLK